MNPRRKVRARGRGGFAELELRPFDFSRETLAEILELDLPFDPEKGRRVAVRATSRAREKEWASHAVVAIARAWVSRGARVLLVDLFFGRPRLHRVFGVRNLEGISDAVGYGASLRRVARPVADEAFWVVTAGTPVADSGALLRGPGWDRFVESLTGSGVTLVTYQPADSAEQPRRMPSIVLACKGERMASLGKMGLKDVVALLGPPAGRASAVVAAGDGENTLGGQAYRASLWDGAPEGAAIPLPEPRSRRRGLRVSAFVVLILVATLMILLWIHNAGIVEVPWADQVLGLFERFLDWVTRLFV